MKIIKPVAENMSRILPIPGQVVCYNNEYFIITSEELTKFADGTNKIPTVSLSNGGRFVFDGGNLSDLILCPNATLVVDYKENK